jgi:hypothetical protein
MEQSYPKTIQNKNLKVYFKPILTYSTETSTLTKRITNKIQAMDITFLRGPERKTRRNRITNYILREDGVQNLLTKLTEK